MVFEPRVAGGMPDRVMKPGGELEGDAGIERRQDAVGEVVLAREGVRDDAAGAKLGHDWSAVDSSLADLGKQVFDQIELGRFDCQATGGVGDGSVRGGNLVADHVDRRVGCDLGCPDHDDIDGLGIVTDLGSEIVPVRHRHEERADEVGIGVATPAAMPGEGSIGLEFSGWKHRGIVQKVEKQGVARGWLGGLCD